MCYTYQLREAKTQVQMCLAWIAGGCRLHSLRCQIEAADWAVILLIKWYVFSYKPSYCALQSVKEFESAKRKNVVQRIKFALGIPSVGFP